jgi:nucleoside-diphosphate-sugar epimerase
LRFADVIGPRDSTGRFLTYYAWIKFHDLKSVPSIAVPQNVVEATSITFVGDAASSIVTAIDESNRGAWDQAYNIGCEEIFNVTSQIMTIGHLLGRHKLRPKKLKNLELYVYPSVTKGPMDVAKAKYSLNFVPTPLDVALLETVAWYETMYRTETDFREEILSELIDILDESNDFESDDDRETAVDALIAEFAAETKRHGEL